MLSAHDYERIKQYSEGEVLEGEFLCPISKSSALLHGLYQEKKAVIKSFKPEDFPEYEALRNELPPVTMEGGYKRLRSFYFKKEAKILDYLTKLSSEGIISPLSPKFYAFNPDPSEQKVVMEYVEKDTFRDKLVEIEDSDMTDEQKEAAKRPLQERLLDFAAHFHEQVNKPTAQERLKSLTINGNDKLINIRSVGEWNNRMAHYLRLIVFSYSDVFREEHDIDDKWEYSSRSWRKLKYDTNQFLFRRGINFSEFITSLRARDNEILHNGKTITEIIEEGNVPIVHGDFGPQNISYCEDPSKVRIFDVDETRLDNHHVDLVHALYHVASNPSEATALELLDKYHSKYRHDSEERFSDFLAEHIESRCIEYIRKIASDARMSRTELRKFSGGLKKSKYANTEFLRRYNLESFLEFLDFYTIGHGRSALNLKVDKSMVLLDNLGNLKIFLNAIMTRETNFISSLHFIKKSRGGEL